MIDLTTTTSPAHQREAPRTLLVPLGSLEQHGPHLPLSTDTLIAAHIAAEVARRVPGTALASAMPLGASGEHAGFAGTLSIGTDVLSSLVVELVRDADRDYDRVVLVNGHGGNAAAIAAAQHICRYEKRAFTVAHCHFADADAHAGRTETSVMLFIAPHLVRADLLEPGNTTPVAELLTAMRAGGVHSVAPNGVLGDPTSASAEQGAALVGSLVQQLVRSLTHHSG